MLLLVGAVFFVAGIVKGVSGMGLPTLSMALLGLVMPPATAAALMVLPSLVTNLAQCLGPHWRTLVRRLWPMWLGVAALALASPLPDLHASGGGARIAMGVVLVTYGLWGLARPSLPDLARFSAAWGALAGAVSGALTAATGVFVMPLVPYLQALRLGKAELVQALGLSFTVATLALAGRLGYSAAATTAAMANGVAMVAAMAGLWMGAKLLRRLPPATFQRMLYCVFLLLGTVMVGRASA